MKLVGNGVGMLGAGSGTFEVTDEGVLINKKNVNLSGLGSSIAGNVGTMLGAAASKKGAYAIPYSALSDAAVMKGGLLSKTFVQLMRPGDRQVRNDQDAAGHPLCLIIAKSEIPNAQRFAALVKEKIRR